VIVTKGSFMKRLISVALALSMVAGIAGTAIAKDHDRHDDRHDDGRGPPGDYRGHDRGPDRESRGHDNGRHLGWHKGGRVDRDEWRRGERINYRTYHLRRPPRGYEWRRVDGDYVLGAIATGLIVDLLLNNR
jgi:Ni/Co efflux regulator RcnB